MEQALSIDVRTSGIWQMTSAVIAFGGRALVIDPGYFPRELAELQALAAARGPIAGVVFTHGHWDHVMGWRSFPSAPIFVSRSLHQAIAAGSEQAQKNLRDAADFDRRWYIDRGAPPAWPPLVQTVPFADGAVIDLQGRELSVLHLPGHSLDGLGLRSAADGLLLVGDYLSPCEIPFVEDLAAYRQTLQRLIAILPQCARIFPGHGRELTAAEALAIAQADLEYLDQIALCAERGDVTAALAVPLPRQADDPDMIEHHRDNVRAAGLPSSSKG